LDRKYQILQAIIELFVSTSHPIGSKFLKDESNIKLSSATLRNEMSKLEKDGLLVQSHVSGGRIPTAKGYRFFVDDLKISQQKEKKIREEFKNTALQYFQEKQADQNLYDIVSILSRLTPNIAFATIPSAQKMFFLGVSQMVMQTEFSSGNDMSGVFRVLEEDLYIFIHSLSLEKNIELFIGNENILPGIDSCSLLVSKGKMLNETAFFGVLGPMRMDYPKNIIAMQEAQKLFMNL